jgi:hypothetical protein
MTTKQKQVSGWCAEFARSGMLAASGCALRAHEDAALRQRARADVKHEGEKHAISSAK